MWNCIDHWWITSPGWLQLPKRVESCAFDAMTSTPIRIVPYSEADLEDVALVHLSAFKGYMSARLGLNYTKAFLRWFLAYPNSITLKAELDGQLCGYAVGAPLNYAKKMSRDLLRIGIMSIVRNPGVILHPSFANASKARLNLLLSGNKRKVVHEPNPDGTGISLVGIGVIPKFSGVGVGHAIMQIFEENAKAIGVDYMVLSVYEDNKRARAMYERSGWQILRRVEKGLVYFKLLN